MRWSLATLMLVACGRLGFDASTTDGSMLGGGGGGGGGHDDGALGDSGTAPGDGSSTAACDFVPSAPCNSPSPFTRVQFAPADCAVGTNCMIIGSDAAQAQTITLSAGDLLVAFAYAGQHPGGSDGGTAPNLEFTVTDSLANTFHAGPYANNAKYDDSAIQIFFAENVKAGADTVTVSESAPQKESFWTGLVLIEYAGVAPSDAVDLASSTSAPVFTSTVTAPAFAVRTGCDLIVGGMTNGHVDESSDTPVSPWDMPVLDYWDPAGFVDDVATGASLNDSPSIAIVQQLGSDDGWASTQIAFRAAATTAPCQPDAIAFESAPQTVATNTCSGEMTVASVAGAGATPTSAGATVALTGSAPTTFYADDACMFPITEVVIGAGTTSAGFWYKSTSSSTVITASASGLGSATQSETD